ncbi:hypothetical protein ABW21_db0201581 [Orbilia brochopaga]|nr:hypothetical protein ABW21_db0201581 [Drechslerella brochopaga]
MRLTITSLIVTLLSSLANAYQLAFTGPDSGEDGYEYLPVVHEDTGDVASASACMRTPLFVDGPLEVLVRARSTNYDGPIRPIELLSDADTRPVPAYIALYGARYPQAGSCNPRDLEQIVAFDPRAKDVQLVASIARDDITYWREIADMAAAEAEFEMETFLGRLIAEYELMPGDVLMRRMDGDWSTDGHWDKVSGAVSIFGYDADIFTAAPLRSYSPVQEDMVIEDVAEGQQMILNEGDVDMTEVISASRWPRLTYEDLTADRDAVRVRPARGDLLDDEGDVPDPEGSVAMDEYDEVLAPIILEQRMPRRVLQWEDYLPGTDESPLLSPKNKNGPPAV